MTLDPRSVVMADTLEGLGTDALSRYYVLILCLKGTACFMFNKSKYVIRKGDAVAIVVGEMVHDVTWSADLMVKVAYISPELIALSTPSQTNFGMSGFVTLFHHPVAHLMEREQKSCLRQFMELERRLKMTYHHFYWECVIMVLQGFYYDIYNVQYRIYGEEMMPLQSANIVGQFIDMLRNGDYRKYRQMAYYADKLNISSRHLSEVVSKNTGITPNRWINMMVSLDISHELRNSTISISEMAYKFHFSSLSYFVRFVQKNLGATPTDIRGRHHVKQEEKYCK